MADGTYERRGPREAELKRFQRLLDERRAASGAARPVRAVVAFGSNLEPRRETIDRALALLAELPGTRLVKTSPVVETEPVDVPERYRHLKFLNGAALFETTLAPLDFSRRMHAIEEALGRVRTERNGPRTIDLDLIVFGEVVMNTPELILPHPRARFRPFVTGPMAELGLTIPDKH